MISMMAVHWSWITYFFVFVAYSASSTTPCVQGQGNFSQLSYREVEQRILESLLKPPYDSRIRPMDSRSMNNNYTSGTVVTINMFIRSFDFIDDVNMQYSVQLTFRQQWNDNRLKYAHFNPPTKLKYLTLSQSSPVWTPDIFFSNEKNAHFHDMLVPNLFIRIFPNGDVLYSARLSMTLSCPMQLRAFPFDQQTCFIRMASYGYTTDDLIFRWKGEDPLQTTSHLELPRFSLTHFTTEYCDSVTLTGTYSCLLLRFSMRRDSSYYNSQIFLPCTMLVIIGWLSFWINRYEPTARMVVMVATVLAMATLISGFNATVPKVSYTKASDVWTFSCFLFIFAALFQFVLVHYLTTIENEGKDKAEEGDAETAERQSLMNTSEQGIEEKPSETQPSRRKGSGSSTGLYHNLGWPWFRSQKLGQQVDLISRVLYPLAFLIFNLSYWPQYYQEEAETKGSNAL